MPSTPSTTRYHDDGGLAERADVIVMVLDVDVLQKLNLMTRFEEEQQNTRGENDHLSDNHFPFKSWCPAYCL